MNSNLNFKLYYKMKLFREVELKIAMEYSSRKMRCPVHLSVGQEAVSAAFSQIVRKNDYAVSSHRPHLHYLGKGGNLKRMISEIYGKKTGCSSGKGGSMHLIDTSVNFMGSSAIVANSIPIGTGLALSLKLKNKINVSYIFFGEGALEQGVFYESVNFAAVKKIPAIFVCENNFYSVYTSLKDRQPEKRKNSKMVEAIGIKSFTCNGNNVFECYKIFNKAKQYVSKEKKPVFLEFFTYRHYEHCGPNKDDNLNYRPKNEINSWLKKDPLKNFTNNFTNAHKQKIKILDKEIQKKIKDAFEYAKKSPKPKLSDLRKDIYA